MIWFVFCFHYYYCYCSNTLKRNVTGWCTYICLLIFCFYVCTCIRSVLGRYTRLYAYLCMCVYASVENAFTGRNMIMHSNDNKAKLCKTEQYQGRILVRICKTLIKSLNAFKITRAIGRSACYNWDWRCVFFFSSFYYSQTCLPHAPANAISAAIQSVRDFAVFALRSPAHYCTRLEFYICVKESIRFFVS